jgi:diguanylate cyclase (GGDEF)-like protein/PAS domain S-box-containing protein
MKVSATNIKLTQVLAKKLYPLTILIGFLISLGTPLTFYLIQLQSLKQTASLYAEDLADDFRTLAANNVQLWKYQQPRFDGILNNYVLKKKLVSIQILEKLNQPIRGYEYQNQDSLNWERKYVSVGSAPIIYNNRTLATVSVTISQTSLLVTTSWLLLFSSTMGIGLAVLVYRFPLAISTRQEGQIQELFNALSLAHIQSESMRQAAETSEKRLHELIQGLNAIVWEADVESKQFLFVSQAAESLLGYPVEKWLNEPNFREKLIFSEDRKQLNSFYSPEILTTNDATVVEYQVVAADGRVVWLRDSIHIIKDRAKKPLLLRGVIVDITARKEAEKKLEYTAFHDPLTGLLNRASFMNRLNEIIKLTKERDNYMFAVLFLDLDRFKIINDSLGHLVGDRLLISMAQRILQTVSTQDKVARLGGDEFVILLEEITDISQAACVAKRILSQLQKPFNLNGHEVVVTTSIGIASSTIVYHQADEILRDADNALYRAKNLGKNRYELFDKDMHAQALARLQMENDLRRALELDQIEVFYQPIVNIKQSLIVGFEALARWQHPNKGLISPVEFIPIAEETGMIVSLSHHILLNGCCQVRQWQEKYGVELFLTINVSPIQFAQPDFVAMISKIIEEAGFQPQYLTLEITESTIIKDIDRAKLIIQELLKLQIKIAMDDFGCGYSSLSYLYQLPINTIKIDRSFVKDLECDREKLAVVQAISYLGNALGINLVAEGIETQQQLKVVKDLNFIYGQGYLFSEPVNAETSEALIAFNDRITCDKNAPKLTQRAL